jgi:glycosyltransferase involved in cell wall biosynthesis
MRIGIDAKWFYSRNNPSGAVVVQNIIEGISKLQTDDVFYIFLDKKDINQEFPYKQENMILVYIWGKVNLLSNLFVLPFYAYKFEIDVFMFQNFNSPFCKCKKVVYIHDVMYYTHPEFFTLKERLYLHPLKWIQYNCDQIITISENEKQRLIRLNFKNPDKIEVVYHGVNAIYKPLGEFDPVFIDEMRVHYSLPREYILYVGRLNIRKNIVKLLEAIPLLEDKDIKLVIVGGADETSIDFDEVINKLNISDRVVMLGYTPFDHLPSIYALAKVFCFPSLEEGFGMPPLEAMASNVPVIVSNTSCMPEICGDAALYFNPHSSLEIASGINKLLKFNELHLQMANNGFMHAKKFNWYSSVNLIYEQLQKTGEIKG